MAVDTIDYFTIERSATSANGPWDPPITISDKTTTTQPHTVPGLGNSVDVYVANAAWIEVDEYVNIPTSGHYLVTGKLANKLTLQYVNQSFNTHSTEIIPSGMQVLPGSFIDTANPAPGTLWYKITGKTAQNITLSYNIVSVSGPTESTPPVVTMTAPPINSTLTGMVTISAHLTDNVGLSQAVFHVFNNGQWVPIVTVPVSGTVADPSIQWDSSSVPNGLHYLAVKAIDASGNFAWPDFHPVNCNNVQTDPGNTLWAKVGGRAPSGGECWGQAAHIGSDGSIYVVGKFNSPLGAACLFGGTTNKIAASGFDMFIAKFNSAGTMLWVNTYGGTYDNPPYGVTTDSAGNVFVVGHFSGSTSFGGPPLDDQGTQPAYTDIFVVKYNSSGVHQFSRSLGGLHGGNYGYGICCNGTDIFITGSFYIQADVGGGTFNSNGNLDAYITKLSGSNLTPLWSKKLGSADADYGKAISIGPDGNPVVSGYAYAGMDFGSGALPHSGGADFYVAKYNGSTAAGGQLLWARQIGGSGSDVCEGVAVDSQNNVYLTGAFIGEVNFGSGIIKNPATSSMFTMCLNSSGVTQWVNMVTAGGAQPSMAPHAIAVDSDRNVIVAGNASGEILDFGDGQTTNAAISIFIVKYRPSGAFVWKKRMYTGNYVATWDVAVDPRTTGPDARTIVTVGYFQGQLDLGTQNPPSPPEHILNSDNRSFYMVKYSP